MRRSAILVALASTGGCLSGPIDEGEEVSAATQEILGGTPASEWNFRRAAMIISHGPGGASVCSATIIDKRYVLSASHCNIQPGDPVHFFYVRQSSTSPNFTRHVAFVAVPFGVNPETEDIVDYYGRLADIAVVALDDDIPWQMTVADMAWRYPGSGYSGTLGGGGISETTYDWNTWRVRVAETRSASDANGGFLLQGYWALQGDSGGPLHVASGGMTRLVGVISGGAWDWGVAYDRLTSVPFHLRWILQAMSWSWDGQPPMYGSVLAGSAFSVFPQESATVCQYACWRTPSCVAYDHMSGSTGQCRLYSSISGYYAQTNGSWALK